MRHSRTDSMLTLSRLAVGLSLVNDSATLCKACAKPLLHRMNDVAYHEPVFVAAADDVIVFAAYRGDC